MALCSLTLILIATKYVSADSRLGGHYKWSNKGQESNYGGVSQTVEIIVDDTKPEAVSVGVSILWREGCIVEFGAVVPRSELVLSTWPDGNQICQMSFPFQDGWGNDGSAVIVFTGGTAKIDVDIINLIEPRAARQYGEYILSKHDSTDDR